MAYTFWLLWSRSLRALTKTLKIKTGSSESFHGKPIATVHNTGFNIPRRWRPRKRGLKVNSSSFKSIAIIPSSGADYNNYNQVQREKENFFVASKSSIKRVIRNFHIVVVQWPEKCTKKRNVRAELLFCLFNQMLFLTFSPVSSLSFLHVGTDRPGGTELVICSRKSPNLVCLLHRRPRRNAWHEALRTSAW